MVKKIDNETDIHINNRQRLERYITYYNETGKNGGAIFVDSNNVNITSSDFNDNKACNGSALYNNASNLLLKDDSFVKNQAWSYTLKANATPNSTYYGSTISIIVSKFSVINIDSL